MNSLKFKTVAITVAISVLSIFLMVAILIYRSNGVIKTTVDTQYSEMLSGAVQRRAFWKFGIKRWEPY